MEDRGVSEDGRRGERCEDVVLGFCHAAAADVMDRWGDLGAGCCRRQRVALVMGVDRGIVAFQDSWGSRKRGIADAEAMLFVRAGRPLRKVNGIGSAEKVGMLGMAAKRGSSPELPLQRRAGAESTPNVHSHPHLYFSNLGAVWNSTQSYLSNQIDDNSGQDTQSQLNQTLSNHTELHHTLSMYFY